VPSMRQRMPMSLSEPSRAASAPFPPPPFGFFAFLEAANWNVSDPFDATVNLGAEQRVMAFDSVHVDGIGQEKTLGEIENFRGVLRLWAAQVQTGPCISAIISGSSSPIHCT
jgi:hypothetical protein